MKKKNDKKTIKTSRVKKLDFASLGHIATLEYIANSWPGEMPRDIDAAFHSIRGVLLDLSSDRFLDQEPHKTRENFVDILPTIKIMLNDFDKNLLCRQIRYHFAAPADLPPIHINKRMLEKSISMLLRHLAMNSMRGGRISISASEIAFRSGKAVLLDFQADDELFKAAAGSSLISRLYEQEDVPPELEEINRARGILLKEGGQMWIEKLPSNRISYRMILPVDKKFAIQEKAEGVFRFDISLCDFNMKRKYFGINKSKSLVHQVENFIKRLVRYPMDMVISQDDAGVVSTIYEAPRGYASSVSNRISRSLAKEVFRVGRKPVDLKFRYKLTSLNEKK